MANVKIVNSDCALYKADFDLILTDPPYDLSGKSLAGILNNYNANHIVLITSMNQFINFIKNTDYEFCFDFVLDAVVPKKSKNFRQPHYTHQNGIYLKRVGVKSAFNRKLRQRSDTFDNNGYWPTILHAPRDNMRQHGLAKNLNIITDILGSFEIKTVIDPFAGAGTTALAASQLDLDCAVVEQDKALCEKIDKSLKFLCANVEKVNF